MTPPGNFHPDRCADTGTPAPCSPDKARIKTIQALGLSPLEAKVVLALYADRDGPLTSDEVLDAIGSESVGSMKTCITRIRTVLGRETITMSQRRYWLTAGAHERIGRLLTRKGVA